MSYFCIVKLLRHIFTSTVICFISLISSEVQAFNYTNGRDAGLDSVKISLLTCSAGDEVYSLYGHTAIRYTDEKYGVDEVINYGVFSFSKPFFVLRFIFGLTDYEMGIMPFEMFCAEYRSEGRSVIQQDLNLTRGEKAAIRDALIANYRPENRVYRYNYFYDNCTTRARDIICDNINGKVRYPGQQQPYPSFRSLIHKFNDEHPWARFGNDMLLGVKADKKTDQSEHQFLPFFLMKDFDKAEIIGADGKPRPLVTKTSRVVDVQSPAVESEFPLSPSQCAWLILAVIAGVSIAEFRTKKKFWAFDTLLLIIDGCLGVIIFTMFFSEHPTTSTNLQVLLLNPLPLIFAYRTARRGARKQRDPFWTYAAVAIIIFFIGGFFQEYAEGMHILALSLLIRCTCNIVYQNKYLSVK